MNASYHHVSVLPDRIGMTFGVIGILRRLVIGKTINDAAIAVERYGYHLFYGQGAKPTNSDCINVKVENGVVVAVESVG